MSQNDPNNSGLGTGTTGNIGSGGTSTGAGYGSGGTGTGMGTGGGMTTGSGSGSSSGFGVSSGSDFGGSSSGSMGGSSGIGNSSTGGGTGTSDNCPHCGQSIGGGGLEQFLGRLGITEEMLGNLKNQFSNVDIDEYMNTARDYLKNSGGKASTYAKENPGKVAAGVAALALGAGLLYAATNRDKT